MISSVRADWGSKRVIGGAVLLGFLALGASSCSSGPSAEAKTFCHSLPAGTPLPTSDVAISVDTSAARAGEQSGDPELDTAATALLKATGEHSSAAISDAFGKAAAACSRLGLSSSVG